VFSGENVKVLCLASERKGVHGLQYGSNEDGDSNQYADESNRIEEESEYLSKFQPSTLNRILDAKSNVKPD
jgi:hypothetical protein